MAYCKFCSNKLDDGDLFCGNCGQKVNIESNISNVNNVQEFNIFPNQAYIVLKRETVMGFAVRLIVTYNCESYDVPVDQEVTIRVTSGVVTLGYKVWCRREQFVTLNTQAGGKYYVGFTYDALWGGFKISKNSILE